MAGIAFGSVVPAPHDPRDGFIVGFSPEHPARLVGRLSKLRDTGISANVAVRREALQATGGFDEMLGPGGYFPCAEDYDLTYRVLSRGYAVLHVPEARVIHYGLRDWHSGRGLIHRTYIAIGAAYMKHVRLRDLVGCLLLGQELVRALVNIGANLAHLRSPFGFGRLRGLLVGALRSFGCRWSVGERFTVPRPVDSAEAPVATLAPVTPAHSRATGPDVQTDLDYVASTPPSRPVGRSITRGALALLSTQPLTWSTSLLVAVFVPRLLGRMSSGS